MRLCFLPSLCITSCSSLVANTSHTSQKNCVAVGVLYACTHQCVPLNRYNMLLLMLICPTICALVCLSKSLVNLLKQTLVLGVDATLQSLDFVEAQKYLNRWACRTLVTKITCTASGMKTRSCNSCSFSCKMQVASLAKAIVLNISSPLFTRTCILCACMHVQKGQVITCKGVKAVTWEWQQSVVWWLPGGPCGWHLHGLAPGRASGGAAHGSGPLVVPGCW